MSLQHFNSCSSARQFRDRRRSGSIVTPALILTFFAFNPWELYTQGYLKSGPNSNNNSNNNNNNNNRPDNSVGETAYGLTMIELLYKSLFTN